MVWPIMGRDWRNLRSHPQPSQREQELARSFGTYEEKDSLEGLTAWGFHWLGRPEEGQLFSGRESRGKRGACWRFGVVRGLSGCSRKVVRL